jgi:hypothetical protein
MCDFNYLRRATKNGIAISAMKYVGNAAGPKRMERFTAIHLAKFVSMCNA